ncbi:MULTISPECIES: hypothetical protein [Zobellia]|uniref:hypothetical protein n=1 Tax=Zobellia TaxID=112040 RepID=UPI001BFF79CE|nr:MULTISPECIES: hypothetical protein [Zobellia]MBT9187015.1 hypothetical protein [Zobellia russellii]MDO6818108.1 hypothetical protein [Zobellia sp. 1_MG-2023]
MKKLFLFFALASTVAFTSCSKDEDDTDAIVGTWVSESSITVNESTTNYREEWVFRNDATGNYKDATNGDVLEESAFSWSKTEEGYLVNYALEDMSDETFTIGDLLGEKTLEEDGYMIAVKE